MIYFTFSIVTGTENGTGGGTRDGALEQLQEEFENSGKVEEIYLKRKTCGYIE